MTLTSARPPALLEALRDGLSLTGLLWYFMHRD